MNKERIEEIIRVIMLVNMVQQLIIKVLDILNSWDEETKRIIKEMAEGEKKHVNEFNKLIKDRSIRPTALLPFWKITGYSLGALSAIYGKQAIMASH